MKKGLIILIFSLLILSLIFVNAQLGNFKENIDKNIEKIDKTKEKFSNIQENASSDYLSREVKKLIEKNPILGKINYLFEFLSPVFVVLMKEQYSLSWRFFIILFFWFFIFINLSKLLRESLFEGWIGYAIGFVVTLLLARVGFFQMFYDFVSGFVMMFTGWKKWIVILLTIIIVAIAQQASNIFSKYLQEQKEEYEKEEEKMNRWWFKKIVSIFRRDLDAR